MEIHFNFDSNEKYTEILAVPNIYTSDPLRPVIIYGTPVNRNPDRLYVVATLLFQKQGGYSISIKDVDCSRQIAIQIKRFFAPIDVFIVNQTIKPRAQPHGSLKGFLNFSKIGSENIIQPNIDAGDMVIRFVTEGVGAMFSEHEAVIGTNLFMDFSIQEDIYCELCASIGAALLYCEDWQISTLHISDDWNSMVGRKNINNIKKLLNSTAVKLEW